MIIIGPFGLVKGFEERSIEVLAKQLLKLRKDRKLTRQVVADAVGISPKSYQRYENAEREPTASVLVALADFYHVTLDELVGRTVPDLAEKE